MSGTGFEQLKKETYFSAMDYWLLVPVLIISLIGLSVLNKVLSDGFGDKYPMNLLQAGRRCPGRPADRPDALPDRSADTEAGRLGHLWRQPAAAGHWSWSTALRRKSYGVPTAGWNCR